MYLDQQKSILLQCSTFHMDMLSIDSIKLILFFLKMCLQDTKYLHSFIHLDNKSLQGKYQAAACQQSRKCSLAGIVCKQLIHYWADKILKHKELPGMILPSKNCQLDMAVHQSEQNLLDSSSHLHIVVLVFLILFHSNIGLECMKCKLIMIQSLYQSYKFRQNMHMVLHYLADRNFQLGISFLLGWLLQYNIQRSPSLHKKCTDYS